MTLHPKSMKLWNSTSRSVAEELDGLFSRPDWTSTYVGHGENGAGWSIDLMCQKAIGDRIAEYCWANRKRLRIWYIIWWGRIISQTRPNAGWQRYRDADSPNPSKSHKNHVHLSLYPGTSYTAPTAAKPTASWKSRAYQYEVEKGDTLSAIARANNDTVAKIVKRNKLGDPAKIDIGQKLWVKSYPKPKSRIVYDDRVGKGVTNSDSVYWVQVALNRLSFKGGAEIPLTGDYDEDTIEEVKKFQVQKCDDPDDGDLGPIQTRYLFKLAGIKVTHRKSSK